MSKTLRTLLKNGTGWRNESLYNSGVRNLFEIMKYEILELCNIDIPMYIVTHILNKYPLNNYCKAVKGYLNRKTKKELNRLCLFTGCGEITMLYSWFIGVYTMFNDWKRTSGDKFDEEFISFIMYNGPIFSDIGFKYKDIMNLKVLITWLWEMIHMDACLYQNEPLYGLWLTSKHGVMDLYEGSNSELSEYKIPCNSIVVSDLGEQGILFASPIDFSLPNIWYKGELIERRFK